MHDSKNEMEDSALGKLNEHLNSNVHTAVFETSMKYFEKHLTFFKVLSRANF